MLPLNVSTTKPSIASLSLLEAASSSSSLASSLSIIDLASLIASFKLSTLADV